MGTERTQRVHGVLTQKDYLRLKKFCKSQGLIQQDFIARLLIKFLDGKEKTAEAVKTEVC